MPAHQGVKIGCIGWWESSSVIATTRTSPLDSRLRGNDELRGRHDECGDAGIEARSRPRNIIFVRMTKWAAGSPCSPSVICDSQLYRRSYAEEANDLPKRNEERVEALHPDPKKKGTRISKEMYEAVREAILDSVPGEEPGLRFMDLSREVEQRAPERLFGNASVGWYTTTMKLDLEARGLIKRVPGVSPQRLVRDGRPGVGISD